MAFSAHTYEQKLVPHFGEYLKDTQSNAYKQTKQKCYKINTAFHNSLKNARNTLQLHV